MFHNQNNQVNIDLLCAMRHFYNKAKYIKSWVLFISIVLPLLYMGYRYAKNILLIELPYDVYLISAGLLWIIIMYFMEKSINNWVILGAKAQEKFDVDLFQIPFNDVLIYDGVKSFKGNKDDLCNWYGDTQNSAPHELKVLISQRINIMWGNELKKKYKKFLFGLIAIVTIMAVGVAIYFNMPFVDSFIFILFPLIPLLYLAFKSLSSLSEQINANKTMDKKILKDCEQFQYIDAVSRCRLYQDYIYSENRIKSILVPNWFYNFFKDETNDKLLDTNNTLLNQYSEVQNATTH